MFFLQNTYDLKVKHSIPEGDPDDGDFGGLKVQHSIPEGDPDDGDFGG